MCLMGLGRFWAKFQLVMAHIQSMLLNGSGMRGSGTGDGEPSPSPLDPMGIGFPPFSSPWGIKSPHPCPLIGKFPTENQGSGPRCHLEAGGHVSRAWFCGVVCCPVWLQKFSWSTGFFPPLATSFLFSIKCHKLVHCTSNK